MSASIVLRKAKQVGRVMSRPIDKVIYDRAAALVVNGWTQQVYARNANGKAVSPLAKTAVQFCAAGALRRAAFEVIGDKTEALVFMVKVPDINDLIDFNESPDATPEAICEVFKARAQ